MNKQANAQINTQAPDDDPVPRDMDEFRNELARRISRFIGNRRKYWRSCKERACRRQHACAAPRIRCSNAPPLPPDPDGRRRARVSAQIQRALREVAAQRNAGAGKSGE